MTLHQSSKNLLPPSRPPRGSPKSPTISLKNFQYFLAPPHIYPLYLVPLYKGHKYKVHKQAQTGSQNRKRVHGEFCGESCGKFCGESCDGFHGASSVNLAAHPFSKTRLNLQATHKNLPRKATTGQNARRCKYSFLGIQ